MVKMMQKIIPLILLLALSLPALADTQTITGRQIRDFTVTDNDLAAGSVTSIKIVDQTIIDNDIANGAVGTLELSDNSILERDLSVIDAPADGECLTYDVGTLSFEWASCASGMSRTPVADANYTVLVTDHIVAYTSITADRTVTLPTAASAVVGHVYYIKDESGSVGGAIEIIVDGNGAETIDGQPNIEISVSYGILAIYSNGTAWFTL